MKIKTIAVFSAFMALTIAACDSKPEDYFVEKIVVQGSMYTGQPMSIDLAKSIRWDDYYDTNAVRLSGADVRIQVDSAETYVLTEANSGVPGTYKADPNAPLVEKGSRYDLRVESEGRIATASTIAAAEFSFDWISLAHNDTSFQDTVQFGVDSLGLYVIWTQDSTDVAYAFLFENLEPDWFSEDHQASDNLGPATSPISAWALQNRSEFLVPWMALLTTGRYRFRMYSCDNALWNYFSTIMVNDPDNEPATNVEGGLGVFSAGGVDTAYFYLVSDLGPQ
jgi:hypothetical protein